MAGELSIVMDDVEALTKEFGKTRDQVDLAIVRALNKTATRLRTRFARSVASQIAVPPSYVGPSQGRLIVSDKASRGNPEIRISGRDQPTSLARFAVGRNRRRGGGVKLRVKKGGPLRHMDNAFLINLRNGNTGLAVRTKDGKPPEGAYRPKEMSPGLWLLYGPSIDQVLRGTSDPERGVFAEEEPWAIRFFVDELSRLLKLDLDHA